MSHILPLQSKELVTDACRRLFSAVMNVTGTKTIKREKVKRLYTLRGVASGRYLCLSRKRQAFTSVRRTTRALLPRALPVTRSARITLRSTELLGADDRCYCIAAGSLHSVFRKLHDQKQYLRYASYNTSNRKYLEEDIIWIISIWISIWISFLIFVHYQRTFSYSSCGLLL